MINIQRPSARQNQLLARQSQLLNTLPSTEPSARQNQLLNALPSIEYERLLPHLELVQMNCGDILYEP